MQFTIYPVVFVLLGGVAGCAPAKPPPATVLPASVSTGRILLMRAVAARANQDPLRAAMITTGASPNDGSRSLVEFIVRTDDGATLSIVQTNEPGFRTGDRVVIMRDDVTHLARPGSQAGS